MGKRHLATARRWVTLLLVLGTGLIGVPGAAQASLTEVADSRFGATSVTRDSATNLDWLDVTVTQGLSFVEVQNRLATDYSGFRFAARSEVRSLFSSAGLPSDGDYQYGFADLGPLLSFVGTTFAPDALARGVFGWTGDFSAVDRVYYATAFERSDIDPAFQQIISTPANADNPLPGGPYSYFGSWLARDVAPVPEPATLVPIALGLAGLGFSRRKQ